MKRLLVTTALEETWGDDVPVLFLGEWCRTYKRKHIWSKVDALVAQPFGVEPAQKLIDIDYVDQLAIKILSELSEELNKFHQVQHSERYWNIVLGHWLKRYVSIAFNRYHTVDQALKNYDIEGTISFEDSGYTLATSDSLDLILACNDDKWNHTFYKRIMAYMGQIELRQNLTSQGWGEGYGCDRVGSDEVFMRTMRRGKKIFSAMAFHGIGATLGRLLGLIGTKFGRNTDAFFIASYLPVKVELKLHLALGQLPQFWICPPTGELKNDSKPRANLKLNCDHFEGFEKYVRWQLAEVIPACYLEGYKNLVKTTEELKWPKNPKFIFTSNAFDTEEIFKVWAASKVEKGIPYIVGQHGNNYGTCVWRGSWCWPERMTSDKFITWGWTTSENEIPAFVFSNAGRRSRQFDNAGGLLLIERCREPSSCNYDTHYEFIMYMEEQFRFVEYLPDHIQQKLIVRLLPYAQGDGSYLEQRWNDRSNHIKTERGELNIRKLISQSRLIVHSYDSTGILETLALNIPTICFWRDDLSHLLPSAKPYYELLHNAGILFYSSETAAKFIDFHWDDISEWWESEKVQEARQIFCEQYARTADHQVQEMKNILTNNL
jgi:putative transferase (TIGR04331 family)